MKKTILLIGLGICQLGASAQWVEQVSGFPGSGIGIIDLKAVSPLIAWGAGFDMSGPGSAPVQYYTRTTSGGTVWTNGEITNAPGMNISSIAAVDEQTAWVSLYTPADQTGSTSGKIFKTTDGGVTWVHQTTATFASPTGFVNKVHFFDVSNGVAIGNVNNGYFEIYTTTNGGDLWTRVPQANIPPALATEIGYINVFSNFANKIWFGTTRGRVFISEDRGLNWVVANTGLTREDSTMAVITNIDFRNTEIGLVQNDSTMRRTNDGGLTWTDMNITGPVHHYDLRYVTGSQQTWISTGANFQANDVGSSISHNDGLDWIAIDDSVLHTVIDFVNPGVGWSGGLNTSITEGGMYKWAGPTALPENDRVFLTSLFPNPASGKVTITGLTPGKAAQVALYDVLGRQVLSETIQPETEAASINLPATTAGIYSVLINTNGQSGRHKLLIK